MLLIGIATANSIDTLIRIRTCSCLPDAEADDGRSRSLGAPRPGVYTQSALAAFFFLAGEGTFGASFVSSS